MYLARSLKFKEEKIILHACEIWISYEQTQILKLIYVSIKA